MRFSSQPAFVSPSASAQSVSVFSSDFSSATKSATSSPRTTGNLLHEIFQSDGGARVFHHFGFDVGSRYVSPFRADATHKNFSVFADKRGRVYFKDFAAGDEASGNFLKLLELYGYADFRSQLEFAAALYGFDSASVGFGKRALPHPTTETKKYSAAERTSTNENTFRITALETAPFSDEELSVLANLSGGFITREILQEHGARALRRYDYEGVNKSGSAYNGSKHTRFTLVVPAADGNYYGYCYYKSDTYSTFPNSAKNFHLKFHAYTSDVKFSLGLETLRPNEAAYIVEGVKDFFVARALGLNAFTLGGVQTRLPEAVRSRLAANDNSLAILFDTDFAGISSSKKLAAFFQFPHPNPLPEGEGFRNTLVSFSLGEKVGMRAHILALPRLARQETQDAPKPTENDLADYVVRYGYDDELRAALAVPVPLASILLTRGGVTAPARELVITKHCAETPAAISTIEEAITHTQRLFLSAPTGSGKTFLMLRHVAMNHHKRTGGRTIFVVPTIALAEQIEQEYRDLPLISITGSDTALSLLEARTSSKIIVCTADSLPKILYPSGNDSHSKNYRRSTDTLERNAQVCVPNAARRNPAEAEELSASRMKDTDKSVCATGERQMSCLLHEENVLLIVDEAHKLFSDYAYRDAAMRGVMSAIERVGEESTTNRVVCISATPNLFLHAAPERLRFEYLHLRTSVQPVRRLAFCPYQCREQEAVNAILREKEHGAVVVRINSESALKTVQTLLLQHGIIADDIDLITSRRRTTSAEYKSITKESRFARRVILTTSLLDCGVNILNADIRAVLIFDERDPATIVQFASRFRRVENLSIMLFHKHTTKTEQHRLFPLSPVQMFQSNIFQAEMRAVEYNASTQMRSKNLHSAIGKKSAFRRFDRSMMFDEVHKVWQADVAGIIAGLDDIRRSTLTRAELQRELEDYGLTIVQREELFDETSSTATTMISAEAVAELTQKAKEQAKSDERVIITMLSEAPELFMEALYHTTESRMTRSAITALFPTIQGKPHHRQRTEECSRLLLERADLFSTTKPDTFGNRYLELRRRLFAHAEAITILERFTDSRTWARFTEHLAMHQRLELKRLNLHTQTLTPHDRKKLEREWEVRNFVANAATVGFVFQGTTKRGEYTDKSVCATMENTTDTLRGTDTLVCVPTSAKRHIKFALHRADDLAQRVNAFTDDAFRLTKQRAGELVSALFHVEYKREREVQENGTVNFGGYYTFRHDEHGITIKTLSDFVTECGVCGGEYEERFQEAIGQVTMKHEEVCAVSSL